MGCFGGKMGSKYKILTSNHQKVTNGYKIASLGEKNGPYRSYGVICRGAQETKKEKIKLLVVYVGYPWKGPG